MISMDIQPLLYGVILSLVTGIPLFLAALSCTPLKSTVVRFFPWGTLPAFLAALLVPIDVVVEVPWFFMGSRMGLDEIGRIFLCLSSFVWFLASLSSRTFVKNERGQTRFLVFFLTAMAGNFGLILARGMLGYYLFFAIMSFAAYGLVVHKRSDAAVSAGRIYLVLVMIGEVALFTALIIMVNSTGSLAFENIAGITYHPLIFVLLFVGFGVKVGALPFHGWMVPAYQAAPAPAAAALAGAMVNAGILGWLRFLPLGQASSPSAALLFVTAGALAAVYGVVIGMRRRQAGEVLACSSISQMGLMTVIFGLGLADPSAGFHAASVLILYVVHHSLAKSSLFFGYDLAERQGGALTILQMAAVLLPALGLAGLPFTSGAIAKTAFKELAAALGEPWTGLSFYFLPMAAIGTSMLMLHFLLILKGEKGIVSSRRTEKGKVFAFSVIVFALTLWLWPAARDSAHHSLTGFMFLQGLWPVVTGSLLYLVWIRFLPWKKMQQDEQEKTIWGGISFSLVRFLQEKESEKTDQDRLITSLQRFIPRLRRVEKIMGRWKMIGLSYITLCLCLLYLLL